MKPVARKSSQAEDVAGGLRVTGNQGKAEVKNKANKSRQNPYATGPLAEEMEKHGIPSFVLRDSRRRLPHWLMPWQGRDGRFQSSAKYLGREMP